MTEQLCHDMTEAGMVTANVVILVGYSNALKAPMSRGSISFSVRTDATSVIMPAVADLYKKITVKDYPVAGAVRTTESASYSAGAAVENCTIVGKRSCVHQAAGGVYLLAGSIVNSIVCNNGGQRRNTSWIDGNISLANSATATYSLTKGKTEIGDAVAGEGNLAGDPRLNTDYSLRTGSPALNKGLNQDWMKGETDISGKKRISGGKVDLGCYERFMQGFYIHLR
jgi:hypothetical protein